MHRQKPELGASNGTAQQWDDRHLRMLLYPNPPRSRAESQPTNKRR